MKARELNILHQLISGCKGRAKLNNLLIFSHLVMQV